jgi:transposase InsO family protein
MTRQTAEQREQTKRWLIESDLADAKLNAVIERLRSDLPFGPATWIPDQSTVFRWQQAIRNERSRERGEPAPRRQLPVGTVSTPDNRSNAQLVQRLPEDSERHVYVERITALKQAAEELHEALKGSTHRTPLLASEFKAQMTWTGAFERGERGARGKFAIDGVQRRYEELRALVGTLMASVSTMAGERAMLVPALGAAARVTSERRAMDSVMPFARPVSDQRIGAHETVEHARPVFGDQIATTVVPVSGAVVRHSTHSKARHDAEIRAILVEPLLAGRLTARQAADLWRRSFRAQTTTTERHLLPSIPEHLRVDARNRYHNVNARTLAQWCRRVSTAEQRHSDGPRPVAVDVLVHHKRLSAADRTRKLTPEVAAHIRRQFLRQTDTDTPAENAYALMSVHNVNATMITEWLADTLSIDLSARTVQRYIATKIADAEKLMARGGSEAADLLRMRMIRQARHPNDVWIADHSFGRYEVTDEQHPEWQHEIRDFDFPASFARHVHSVGQRPTRRLVAKFSMTLIVDAFSRRKLALRVWEGTPSTRDTLLALYDAVSRFGVPEFLYTDNGADFKSRAMMAALLQVGIKSVHSRPYCPQGRGIVERDFQTIKTKILPLIPGFHGDAASAPQPVDELDDHTTFERKLWDRVDRVLNNMQHSETGEIPAQHYDRCAGARALQQPSEEAKIGLLSEREDAVRESIGVKAFGGRYQGPGLNGIPEKGRIIVHGDPYRLQLAHISTYDAHGSLRYRGPVERYGQGGAEAPQADALTRLESEWREDKHERIRQRRLATATHKQKAALLSAGEVIAVDLSEAVQSRIAQLSAGTRETPQGSLAGAERNAPPSIDDGRPRESAAFVGDQILTPAVAPGLLPMSSAVTAPRATRAAAPPRPSQPPPQKEIATLWNDS